MIKRGHNTNFRVAACCLLLLLLLAGCTVERHYALAPTLTPGTQPEMNTPGYWIGRHPDPDRLLMTSAEIDLFNARIRTELKTVADITAYPATISGRGLRRELESAWQDIAVQGLWRKDGSMSDAPFFASLKQNLSIETIGETVAAQFALVTGYADQRVLPTAELLSSDRGDWMFDELQNSAYDIGTPLAVVHTSADGQWVYAVAPLSNGWMPADRVAFCTREEMTGYLQAPPATVFCAKADLYRDYDLRQFHASVRLGTRLRLTQITMPASPGINVVIRPALLHPGMNAVTVPIRDAQGQCRMETMFAKASIMTGCLPLTPRSLIQTAFEMLNTPYGWGGMYGEQDCSRFIQQVFAAHGVQFPRNSTAQGQVGRSLGLTHGMTDVEKDALLTRDAIGGATVLELSGHIMLYLGSVDGKPYAIHDIWGYREHDAWRGDTVRAINRVAVTNLEIGRGSARGALISRLRSARSID